MTAGELRDLLENVGDETPLCCEGEFVAWLQKHLQLCRDCEDACWEEWSRNKAKREAEERAAYRAALKADADRVNARPRFEVLL